MTHKNIKLQNNFYFFISCLLIAALFCGSLEVTARISEKIFHWPNYAVDIQTPGVLSSKIDYFAAHNGPKVAIVGDSLVYGSTMSKHGIKNWRSKSLSAYLNKELYNTYDRDDILVMNFGMDGLLLTEILKITHILSKLGANAIIVNISLRSVSDDFNIPEESYSRKWIQRLKLSSNNSLVWHSEKKNHDLLHGFANKLQLLIEKNSKASQALQYSKAYLFQGGSFSSWFKGAHTSLNNALMDTKKDDFFNQEILDTLKAKKRYSTSNFDSAHIQVEALHSIFKTKWPQPVILFYSNENPNKINNVVTANRLYELRKDLKYLTLDAQNTNKNFYYVGPIKELSSENFLDLVHVVPKGYELYAKALTSVLVDTKFL
jgi:hypothetical protein